MSNTAHTENARPARGTESTLSTGLVLGSPIALTDYRGAFEQIRSWTESLERAYLVSASNTHVVTLARHDPAFGRSMARFDLSVPDGMPLVWALNRGFAREARLTERVYGPQLMQQCFAWTQDPESAGHFLLGGSGETLAKLQENLGRRFPRARILGVYSPPFGAWPSDEHEKICERIRESGARMIWVGLGCPKQERWMSEMKRRLPPGVYFGIGAAFRFHAGEVPQAPAWLQRLGLEWFYRLIKEPRRLFRRYITYNSLFLFYSARDKIFGAPGAQHAE